jgi:hypothetical protein
MELESYEVNTPEVSQAQQVTPGIAPLRRFDVHSLYYRQKA